MGDGRPPLRRAVPLAVLHAQRASRRTTRPTTTSTTPARSGRRAGRCGSRRPTRGTASTARRSARSAAGSGSTTTSRTRRPATSRCARAAGPGSTGRRRSAPSTGPRARRVGALRRDLVRQDRGRRARAPPRCSSASATTGSRARSGRSPTRRCSTRAAGSSATSPSRGSARSRFSIVTGTAFGNHDLAGSAGIAAGDGGVQVRDVTSRWACFGIWGPRARDVLAAADAAGPRQRGLPVHDHARDHRRRRAGARAAGHLRRRARLGALLPDGVRRRAVADALGGGRSRTGCCAGGYRAIDSLRLEKGYRVWGSRHHARRDAVRGRARLLRAARQGRFIGRDALEATERGPRTRLCCLAARRPALGRARQRAGPRRAARSSAA